MMTALGSAVSPQARRQARIRRSSRRRHSPSRVQRANSVYSVPNGISHSCQDDPAIIGRLARAQMGEAVGEVCPAIDLGQEVGNADPRQPVVEPRLY